MYVDEIRVEGEVKLTHVPMFQTNISFGGLTYYINYGRTRKGEVTLIKLDRNIRNELLSRLTTKDVTIMLDNGEKIKCIVDGEITEKEYAKQGTFDLEFTIMEVF